MRAFFFYSPWQRTADPPQSGPAVLSWDGGALRGITHTHTSTLVLDSCLMCVCVYKAKTQLALMARGQGLYIMDETERERAVNPHTLI